MRGISVSGSFLRALRDLDEMLHALGGALDVNLACLPNPIAFDGPRYVHARVVVKPHHVLQRKHAHVCRARRN